MAYWVRNLALKATSFRLQTATDRFYPDFVCQLKDGRVLVVEYRCMILAPLTLGADSTSDTGNRKEKFMSTTSSTAAADERPLRPTAGVGQRIAWRSGLAGLILQGAVIATFVFGMLLTASLPSHLARRLESSGPIVTLVLLAVFCALGGALWARTVARISGVSEPRRLAWAGALAFGPPLVLVVLLLNEGEKYFVEGPGQALAPVHVVFAIFLSLIHISEPTRPY